MEAGVLWLVINAGRWCVLTRGLIRLVEATLISGISKLFLHIWLCISNNDPLIWIAACMQKFVPQ